MSDPVVGVPTLEERVDDVRAVTDAVGSSSAFLCGLSEGGPVSILYAATYPERTRGLVLLGAWAKMLEADDYGIGLPRAWLDEVLDEVDEYWGQGGLMDLFLPSFGDDERARRLWARYQRLGGQSGHGSRAVRDQRAD